MESRSRWFAPGWIALGVALAGLVGVLDVATGFELGFELFYLPAVAAIAWKVGRSGGLMLAVVSAAIWFAADHSGVPGSSDVLVQTWNVGMRLASFSLFAVLVAAFRQARDQEQALSRVDSLTEASNRSHFLDRLGDELERSRRYRRPLTLAYLDLDHFKRVNDHLGHAVGDQVLQVVATTLLARLRKTDVLARFGGDEFAILLTETDSHAAKSAVEALRTELLDRMGGHGWPVTASVGVVTASSGSIGVEALLREAEELMYRAKEQGRNRVLWGQNP